MKPSHELMEEHRKVVMQADGFREVEQPRVPGLATFSGGREHRTPPSVSRARSYNSDVSVIAEGATSWYAKTFSKSHRSFGRRCRTVPALVRE